MRWCILAVSSLAGLSIVASSAVADDHRVKLPTTVITATRTRNRPEEVTTPTAVIDGADIEQRDQILSADALRGAPGVDLIEFGSPGRSAFAALRGAAPDQ